MLHQINTISTIYFVKESNKDSDRELTDLEGVVIAFVYKCQPCTPYAIRKSFEKSPTGKFSNSAGSIYPLVKRLVKRGYLVGDDTPGDGRGSCLYSATPVGIRKVRAWLANLDEFKIGIYDPIRSRLANLNLLSGKDQLLWLKSMIALLEQQKDLISLYEEQDFLADDKLLDIVREGLWAENKMRLQWLRNAKAALETETHVE